MKRVRALQSIVAGSRRALPVATVYGLGVWLMAGAAARGWWMEMLLFLLSAWLMVQLNDRNLLIRIYSRAVSVTFVLLSSAAVFLFPSLSGGFLQVCMIASLAGLYSCYQDHTAVGRTYYCFVVLGLGSVADVHLLWYVPAYYLLMGMIVYCLSWRTLLASVLGLLTPYWLMAPLLVVADGGSMDALADHLAALADHFAALADVQTPLSLADVQTPLSEQSQQSDLLSGIADPRLMLPRALLLALVTSMGITGSIHFLRNSRLDKIRVRQLYYGLMLLGAYSLAGIAVQPQCFDMFVRMLIVATSALFGHFAALTHTRVTNVACLVVAVLIAVLTAYNLWSSWSSGS